jgi:hypothetical protein
LGHKNIKEKTIFVETKKIIIKTKNIFKPILKSLHHLVYDVNFEKDEDCILLRYDIWHYQLFDTRTTWS